jgi:hypothetical protein
MASDLEHAAIAVRRAIVEKFWKSPTEDLQVTAADRFLSIQHEGNRALGTRDDLLASLRKATSLENFWEVLKEDGRCRS